MIRRWIIRGFFIGQLLACLAIWLLTGPCAYVIGYEHQIDIGDSKFYDCMIGVGMIYVGVSEDFGIPYGSVGKTSPDRWVTTIVRDRHPAYHLRFPGFAFRRDGVSVPLWFLSILSSLLLWRVWRSTRPKPNAFPVEIKQAA